jgi:hypothetical protein
MIKQTGILLIPAFFAVLLLYSCTSEQLTPDCNTQNMSYSQNVVPILKSNCYKCHSAGNTVGSYGHALDSYASLTQYTNRNDTIIVAGDTTIISYLEGVITHTPPYISMPYMDGKLDTCAIKQIQAWITQGAHDN